jgi:hypothetical protein
MPKLLSFLVIIIPAVVLVLLELLVVVAVDVSTSILSNNQIP